MRILIVNYDYPAFLEWLYESAPGLESESFAAQRKARMDSLFGVADFYSSSLTTLGHEAWEVHLNNHALQSAWCREHGIVLPTGDRQDAAARRLLAKIARGARSLGWHRLHGWCLRRLARSPMPRRWMYHALAAQILEYRPDVLLNQYLFADPSFFHEMATVVPLVAGQHASPLPPAEHFRPYRLVLSSLPNLVQRFRSLGLRSALHRLAFEPRVLGLAGSESRRDVPVSFVGSLGTEHERRRTLLEFVARSARLGVWGDTVDRPVAGASFHGPAWGIEMYRVLRRSRITLNQHLEVAGDHANNLRLYEATGCGTLLITDAKSDLATMFEPDREVVAYCTGEQCSEMVTYYLEHAPEAVAIARAGQARTLRDHTYQVRMPELVEILEAAREGRPGFA